MAEPFKITINGTECTVDLDSDVPFAQVTEAIAEAIPGCTALSLFPDVENDGMSVILPCFTGFVADAPRMATALRNVAERLVNDANDAVDRIARGN